MVFEKEFRKAHFDNMNGESTCKSTVDLENGSMSLKFNKVF